MIENALIIHGTKGSPEGNWFPWLARELRERGIAVELPTFPTPDRQSPKEWRAVVSEVPLGENSVIIGHSLGALFTLHLLRDRRVPICGAFLISPFLGALGLEEYDELNRSFFLDGVSESEFELSARRTWVFAGDNDPYVPLTEAAKVAKLFHTQPEVVRGGGHLNAEFGYRDFPLLLSKIMELN